MSWTFFCHNIDTFPIGGCTSWTVSTSSVTATDFWVSPSTEAESTYDARLERDLLMVVRGDEIHIRHGSNIVYTADFGDNWTTEAMLDWMPIDTVWDEGEKTSTTFSLCAWPNGYPSSAFSLQGWRYVSGELICIFFNSDSDTSFVANISTGTILRTGFTYNAKTETSALQEGHVGVPYLPADECRAFCYWDGRLTTLGIVYELSVGDPYPQRHALLKGDIAKANAVTLSEGSVIPYSMEVINDELLWFGDWGGASGGSLSRRYGRIHNDISFGGIYTFDASWRLSGGIGPTWYADSAPTFQPTKTETIVTGGNYPNTLKQRPAKWLNSEVMYAGTTSKRYGYVYTNLTDSAQKDYASIWNYGARGSFEVMPVPEKGAFISMEVINTNLRSTTIKISPTAEPGDFSSAVTLTLPVAVGVSKEVAMFYSSTQAKFLMVYRDSASKIHVVQFEDPFVCAVYE